MISPLYPHYGWLYMPMTPHIKMEWLQFVANCRFAHLLIVENRVASKVRSLLQLCCEPTDVEELAKDSPGVSVHHSGFSVKTVQQQ